MQNGALHDFAAVADEGAAGVGAAFDGELNALSDGHASDLLEESLTAPGVRFGFRSGVRERLVVARNSGTAKFVEDVFLVGG